MNTLHIAPTLEEASNIEETVTVLFSDEVYDLTTLRCVEIEVIAVTGTRLQVAVVCKLLRNVGIDILDVEENIKIYEECKIALQKFKKKSNPQTKRKPMQPTL